MAIKIPEIQKDVLYKNGYYDNNIENLSVEEIDKLIQVEQLNNLTIIRKIMVFFCLLAVVSIILGIVVAVKLSAISRGIY